MAKFSRKDIFFKDGDMAVFGTDQDSKLYWDGNSDELRLSTTISGVTPTEDYQLTTKQYVDDEFARVVSSGIYNAYFDAYDGTGGANVTGGWTDVPLGTERRKTVDFSHEPVTAPAEVIINSPGTYIVIARVSVYQSAGNSNSEASMQLIRDSGSGYQTVSGTLARLHSDNTNQGASTATVAALLDLEQSDGLRIQAKRESGGGTINLLAEGSSLVIFPAIGIKGDKGDKGDQGAGSSVIVQDNGATISGSPFSTLNFKSCELEVPVSGTVDILPRFGSWYGYTLEDSQTDTSSTSWIQKATFSVAGVPVGIYRVGWYYEWQYSNRTRNFQAQVQLNNSYTLASQSQEPKDAQSTQWAPVSGFTYVYLSTGSNYVDLDFRASNTSDTAKIRRARIEFWRES